MNTQKSNKAPQAVKAQKNKKPSRSQKRAAITAPVRPNWFHTLRYGLSKYNAHIPDDNVESSGLCHTVGNFVYPITSPAGSSTTHNFAYIFYPHPNAAGYVAVETSAGNGQLTTVNAAGTALAATFFSGASGSRADITNLDSVVGGGAGQGGSMVRMTGMNVRLTYQGTVLNSSARVAVGYIPVNKDPKVVTTTGTVLDPLSSLIGSIVVPASTVITSMYCKEIFEMPAGGGYLDIRWLPNRTPTYQLATNSVGTEVLSTAAAGVNLTPGQPSLFKAPVGGNGVQEGQNALVIVVTGDTTPSAGTSSNTYGLDYDMCWETIPSNPALVAYDLESSPSDPVLLARCLNAACSLKSADFQRPGSVQITKR